MILRTITVTLLLIGCQEAFAAPRQEECKCTPVKECSKEEADGVDVDPGLDFREIANYHFQKCGAFKMCCKNVIGLKEINEAPPYEPPPSGTCGIRNFEGLSNKMVDANLDKDQSRFGEFPWQAAILKRQGPTIILIGGGALIHNKFVLTTPHILKDVKKEELLIRLGDYDLVSTLEQFADVTSLVKEIIIHENVNYKTGVNDIALLYMDPGVEYQPNILPICLPDADEIFDPYQMCTVTGWGKNATDARGNYNRVMKVMDLPLIDNYECQDRLRNTRLGSNYVLSDKFRCALPGVGVDSCKGDGGGPLACEKYGTDGKRYYKAAGLVAWGIGCGDSEVPGVYVDVTKYIDWIDKKTSEKLLGRTDDEKATADEKETADGENIDELDFKSASRPGK